MWGLKRKIIATCGSIALATAGAFIAFPVERYLNNIFPEKAAKDIPFTGINALTAEGCDTNCLPQLTTFDIETGFELYSQDFGITDATGVMQYQNGAIESFDIGYIAGGHAYPRPFFVIPDTVYKDFDEFSLCLTGLHETTGERITWKTSYNGKFIDKYSGVRFRRTAPIIVSYGDENSVCAA